MSEDVKTSLWEVRGGVAAALLALGLLCGCATPMPHPQATTARRIGPIAEWQETSSGASLFALRPIYSHEETGDGDGDFRSVTDILWPIGTVSRRNDRHYWRFLLFYGTGGAKSRLEDGEDPYRFRLFPIFFSGRSIDNEPYTAVFPIAGTIRNFLVFDRVSFFLFPLYADGETAGVEMRTVLWPFYLERHGENLDQLRLWPIYGDRTWRGRRQTDFSRFVLWPFWTETHTEGDLVNGGGFVLFPIYGHQRYERKKRGEEETWMVVPPFFAYGRGDDGYRKLYAPWPFIRQLDHDDVRERHWWPIYGSETNNHTRREYAIWPLFQHTIVEDDYARRSFVHAPIPFYFHYDIARVATNVPPRTYSRVWPLFSHRENELGTTTRVPELSLWSQSQPIERNWAPLWTLFSHRTRPDGAYCTDILWGLFSWGRNAESKRFFRLLWFFGSRSFNSPPLPDEPPAPKPDADAADAAAPEP